MRIELMIEMPNRDYRYELRPVWFTGKATVHESPDGRTRDAIGVYTFDHEELPQHAFDAKSFPDAFGILLLHAHL